MVWNLIFKKIEEKYKYFQTDRHRAQQLHSFTTQHNQAVPDQK